MVFIQKQGMNIYTVMLILSLLAVTMGCIFLAIEMSAYGWDIKASDTSVFRLGQEFPGMVQTV